MAHRHSSPRQYDGRPALVNKAYLAADRFLATLRREWSPEGSASDSGTAQLTLLLDKEWAVVMLSSVFSCALFDTTLLEMRPAVKRAIVALEATTSSGRSRAESHLVALVKSTQSANLADMRRFSGGISDLPGSGRPHVMIASTGKSMQLAQDANVLRDMGEAGKLVLLQLAVGRSSPRVLVGCNHISRLPKSAAYDDMWKGMLLRFSIEAALRRYAPERRSSEICYIPRSFYAHAITTGGTPKEQLHFDPKQIHDLLVMNPTDTQYARSDKTLTAYPLREAFGGYWTSWDLVLDSIAPWMTSQVLAKDGWQVAVSSVFEQRVDELFSARGYVSGSVSERGYWSVLTADPDAQNISRLLMAGAAGCPGEIDTLAWNPRTRQLHLVECKSVAGIRNSETSAGTFTEVDAAGWRSKVERKTRWVEAMTGIRPNCSIAIEGIEYSEVTTFPVPIVSYAALAKQL